MEHDMTFSAFSVACVFFVAQGPHTAAVRRATKHHQACLLALPQSELLLPAPGRLRYRWVSLTLDMRVLPHLGLAWPIFGARVRRYIR